MYPCSWPLTVDLSKLRDDDDDDDDDDICGEDSSAMSGKITSWKADAARGCQLWCWAAEQSLEVIPRVVKGWITDEAPISPPELWPPCNVPVFLLAQKMLGTSVRNHPRPFLLPPQTTSGTGFPSAYRDSEHRGIPSSRGRWGKRLSHLSLTYRASSSPSSWLWWKRLWLPGVLILPRSPHRGLSGSGEFTLFWIASVHIHRGAESPTRALGGKQ